ncbi:MAG: glycosyltransferase, partial [Thermoanaerobaculum sp.]|nr:glycosyltransferase [Thermoanaerobaculum sp.]MDW7966795.1 glycosyltransferase [Thermoanaerobaculum sp.]
MVLPPSVPGPCVRNTAAELLHARQGPLVSVVIRTTFRPELVDAVAAVRAQLYRPLEALVVDAAGRGDCPPLDFGDVPWRFITQSKPLSRP